VRLVKWGLAVVAVAAVQETFVCTGVVTAAIRVVPVAAAVAAEPAAKVAKAVRVAVRPSASSLIIQPSPLKMLSSKPLVVALEVKVGLVASAAWAAVAGQALSSKWALVIPWAQAVMVAMAVKEAMVAVVAAVVVVPVWACGARATVSSLVRWITIWALAALMATGVV
jgi:hypothetical protein